MTIISPAGNQYTVGEQIGCTERFNLYECLLSDGKKVIFKIATSVEHNGLLDREAFLLQIMREEAQKVEEEYAQVKPGSYPLNYHLFFPNLIESFLVKDQDNRRASVLSFFEIASDLSQLTPLLHLASRDHVRIDPRTSAWILGKLLKLLVFTHSHGIVINELSGDNILINRKDHLVAIFDWTSATMSEEEVSPAEAGYDISEVAEAVMAALGADPNTGEIPPDEQLADDRYQNFLFHLASTLEDDAGEAHRKFYDLIWSLWPRSYHPFTTHALIY